MAMKTILLLALGVCLLLHFSEAAPSWARDIEGVENMVNFDQAKRSLNIRSIFLEERILRNRLEKIENEKKSLLACSGTMNKKLKCVKPSQRS